MAGLVCKMEENNNVIREIMKDDFEEGGQTKQLR